MDEKTYSQKEIDLLINEAKANWQKEADEKYKTESAKKESEIIAAETEKAQKKMQKEREAFEEERNAYKSEKAEFNAQIALAKENLPMSFANLLASTDETTMTNNIQNFKSEYEKAIELKVSDKLKSTVPETAAPEKTEPADEFFSGFDQTI